MASSNKSTSVFLSFLLLVSLISFVHSINNGGITVNLIHRDSPLSPSYDPSQTRFERLRRAFDRSFARKSSLALASSKSLVESIEALIVPIDSAEYLLQFYVGTPPVEQLGVADTGSDLTWIQCKPCEQCYKQKDPLFDPTKSKSFTRVPCQSDQCAAGGRSASCGENNRCEYHISYGDNSFSNGEIAAETFTLGNASFPKVLFGCGHSNDGTFSELGTGIFGLGGGRGSIIRQLDSSIGGRFSYCLTLLSSYTPNEMSFGSSAVVRGPNVLSTPLVKKSPDTFYYLTLEGISVGTERLEYKSNSKALFEEGNVIIDSGTTLTFVPSELYDGIESALEKGIRGKRLQDPQGKLNLCYQRGNFSAPPITAHFRGADLVLPQENTFVEVVNGILCLTLVPSEDLGIFGNLNQRNFRIGYDLVNQQVNFLPTDCSKPAEGV